MLYFYDQPAADAARFCAIHNDELSSLVARCPTRFAGVATLPMQDPVAAAIELRRALDDLHLNGVCIGGRFGDYALSDAAYDPIWALLSERGLPAIVHPGPLDSNLRPQGRPWDLELIVGFATDETLAITHLVLGGVLDRHPGLRVLVPHGGGFAPYVRSRFAMALDRRAALAGLLRRSLDEIWRQMTFDCLVHDAATLDYLVSSQGADRVVVGTNFAAWDQDDHIVDLVRALDCPAGDRDAILGANAARLFRLPAPESPSDGHDNLAQL
jgi:aminocarboxymuconate-semialdehyde decarboxylase